MKLQYDKVVDSGDRQVFSTGSVRDKREGKGRFDLIPYYPLERLAQHYENGAKKYGPNNWKLGQPLHDYLSAALSHATRLNDGWEDEDHASAAVWNVFAFEWTLNEIINKRLPDNLCDVDWIDLDEERKMLNY